MRLIRYWSRDTTADFNIRGLIFRRIRFTFKDVEVVHKPGPRTVTIPSILKTGAQQRDPTTVPAPSESSDPSGGA